MTAIHPTSFVTFYDQGLGNIGSLTDNQVRGRFHFHGKRMALKSARVHWYAGTGAAATLTMYSHAYNYAAYRTVPLWDWTSRTIGADANILCTDEEMPHFIIEPDEDLVFIWVDSASPDDTSWNIKLVMMPL